MNTPRDERALEAATVLTDTLDLAMWQAPLDTTAGDDPLAALEPRLPASPGMRLLAEIARVHRSADPAPEPRPALREPPLFRWGHLQVTRALGQGSYGEVYAAWDPQLQREVALKLVRVQAGTLRWLDEARSLARVHHPNVLTIHGADLREERAGLWTEQVIGRTLEEELEARGPLPPAESLRIGHDLASALAAVHAAGLVHGDLKTSNVMIEGGSSAEAAARDGSRGDPSPPRRVVLMDFGAARVADRGDDGAALTTTPMFAAPEVLEGASPDARSDVYALGVVLYRLLTHRSPVEAADLPGLIAAHTAQERVPLLTRRADVPHAVAAIVERAIAPRPTARFATAAEVRDAFGRLLGERPRLHVGQLVVTATALAAVIGLAFALDRQLAMRDTNRVVIPPPPTLAISTQTWWASPAETLLGGMGWMFSAADFDRDGRTDLLIADAGYSRTQIAQGRALVFSGSPRGPVVPPTWSFLGQRSNDLIAASITCAGDVNGDGFEDALVRDPSNLMGGPPASGAVLVFRGTAHGLENAPSQVLIGDTPGGGFGNRLAAAGDVNGDGFD